MEEKSGTSDKSTPSVFIICTILLDFIEISEVWSES